LGLKLNIEELGGMYSLPKVPSCAEECTVNLQSTTTATGQGITCSSF